ncbi:hypothetical protein [Paeniglutamicibacter sp.]|uniref:hypothetical protein n=1 Tax=Paeniglutamicibacter sp. TaxID=1934391 RepID=UPI00398905AE
MAPEIRMRANLSGSRDGKKWPPRGGTLEVPEAEAKQLFAQGIAEPADAVEMATVDAAAETATTKGKTVAQVRAEAKAKQETAEAADAKAKQEEADRIAAEAADAEKAEADRLAAEAKAAEESKGAKK